MLLKNCCFCISLRTGVLAINIISIVLSTVALLSAPITFSYDCQGIKHTDNDPACEWADVKLGITILTSVVNFVINIFMIYASEQNKYKMLLRTIILESIHLGVSAMCYWYLMVTAFMEITTLGLTWLAIGTPILGVYTYLWIVTFSRYQEIKKLKYGKQLIVTSP